MNSAGQWANTLAIVFARAWVTYCLCLFAWATVPALAGLETVMVTSGSMAPKIQPGDVVVAQKLPVNKLRTGMVVVVNNPAAPGQLLTHRVVGKPEDGMLRTKGDANDIDDSTPVPLGDVRGAGRLLVPQAAAPLVWWQTGKTGTLLLWAVSSLIALAVALQRTDDDSVDQNSNKGPKAQDVHDEAAGAGTAAVEQPNAPANEQPSDPEATEDKTDSG